MVMCTRKKPHEGIIKVNTHAAIFKNSGCYSYAMLARDHEGKMMEAVAKCIQGSINPELAEAMGIREALKHH